MQDTGRVESMRKADGLIVYIYVIHNIYLDIAINRAIVEVVFSYDSAFLLVNRVFDSGQLCFTVNARCQKHIAPVSLLVLVRHRIQVPAFGN